ncbi:MAG: MOSC domain-containing protein [Acidobacteriaceae bacterium]|nr:MOSC domain-containing protein [Acidobacteriaceae bacterium]
MVLSQIFVYPIKSARGVAVHEAAVDSSGPLQDRRWMLVDSNGSFLSQRRLPKMALLSPRFSGDDLVVEAPDMPPLVILRWSGEGDWVPVRIWHDQLQLPHPKPEYSEWFSAYLRQSCRLVHLPPTVIRPVEPPYDRAEWRVSLADGYPLLLLTQASLDLLNQQLTVPVTVERFRPNLVVAGAAAHEEDQWRRLRVGEVEMAVVKSCARCSIVLVDPDTGERGIEPLRTLARYRRKPQKVLFAQNALVTVPGLLRVGASIEVLEAVN